MTTEVPNDDVLHMVFLPAQCLVDFHKSVDAGCRVDFQIYIQHTPLFAGETKPGLAFSQGNAEFHQQETLTGLGRADISLWLSLNRKIVLLIPLTILIPYLTKDASKAFIAEPIADAISATVSTIIFLIVFPKVLKKGEEGSDSILDSK